MTMNDPRRDRAIGSLVGLAVGDAVGTTLEFEIRDTYEPLTDMVGGGPFRLRPGEWTDDTSMALCLADSLIETGGKVDKAHLLTRFVRWWEEGHNSVRGECFDIGMSTRDALIDFKLTGSECNNTDPDRQANGSIMRLSPAVICACTRDSARANARDQGLTTHAAAVPTQCCDRLAGLLWDAIEAGKAPPELLKTAGKPRHEIRSTGHAPATLEAACWSVATTGSFRDAVLAAANLGGDADTVGAVAGQIAGALYGLAGIPAGWVGRLAWRDEIVERAQVLWDLRSPRG